MTVSDLHVHSSASCDCDASIWEMCDAAVQLGLEAVAFTDHLEFKPEDPCYKRFDYAKALYTFEKARSYYDGTLEILFGVEVTYWSDIEDEIRDYLRDHQFDIVIGAIHYAPPVDIWSPADAEYVKNDHLAARRALKTYFSQVEKLAKSRLFDAVAHFGIYQRYIRTWPPVIGDSELEPCLMSALDAIVRYSRLELNAATLHMPVPLPLPSVEVMKIYKEMGGLTPIYGSDAHTPSKVGKDLGIALDVIKQAGFGEFASWRDVVRPTGPRLKKVSGDEGVSIP